MPPPKAPLVPRNMMPLCKIFLAVFLRVDNTGTQNIQSMSKAVTGAGDPKNRKQMESKEQRDQGEKGITEEARKNAEGKGGRNTSQTQNKGRSSPVSSIEPESEARAAGFSCRPPLHRTPLPALIMRNDRTAADAQTHRHRGTRVPSRQTRG